MNFLTAKVVVKVDDSKLPAQLTRVKSITLRTVNKIKASFAGMATSFKKAFDKMIRIAKYAAVGIAGALAFVTRAAMKQEDAVFQLGAALKATGEYTRETMERFKAFASSIQQVTIYGDEQVLAVMRMGSTLGITSGKLEEATIAALSLGAAFGGRMRPEMAMRYYAQALEGVTSSLETYVVAMRGVETYEEKMAVLQEALARGWAIATAQAETASGALWQMWNALGDVAEVMGDSLLPAIKDTTKAIKEWAERNQERIGVWAKEVVKYVGLVKNVFLDYVRYLRMDWRNALSDTLTIALLLLKGFGQASVVIMKLAGRLAGEAFIAAFGEPIVKFADKWVKMSWWKRLLDPEGSAKYAIIKNMAETIRQYNKQVGADTVRETQATWDKIKQIIKTTQADIRGVISAKAKPDFVTTFPPVMRFEREPFSWEETAGTLDIKKFELTDIAVRDVGRTFDTVGDKIQVQISAWQKGVEDFGWSMENSIHYALENTMRDFSNWKDHLLRFFEEIYWAAVRIAFIEPLAKSVAGAFTGALTGGAFAPNMPEGTPSGLPPGAPGSRPGLKDGGYVEKTGWAKVHKGETYSGVGGSGTIDVRIHNESRANLEISEVEESDALDQRILDITIKAAGTNSGYRRSISKIRR